MKNRLPPQPGEWIDRQRVLPFHFEDQQYEGLAGDVITSALLAEGVHLLGRSFKYHRARGSYSLAGHDANVILADTTNTNLHSDTTLLTSGLKLSAVNTTGGVRSDRLKFISRLSKFLPVGFYYKTFHRPAKLFPFHERQIRKISGLGVINPSSSTPHSPKDHAWCDVLVVGGGPAGLEAALAAGKSGAQVLIAEESAQLGGSLLWQHGQAELVAQLSQDLITLDNVDIRCATQVGGHYADNWIALFDTARLTKLRAKAVVYATGVMEQPAVFGYNDLPGIMLCSAIQRLISRYAVKPFERVVILGANSEAYTAALAMNAAGIQVAGLADLRPDGESATLTQQVASLGIPIHRGFCIYEAQPTSDKTGLSGALLASLDSDGRANTRQTLYVECDGIAVSVGWMPNAALPSQAGVRFTYDENLEQLTPNTRPEGVFLAGRVRGVFKLDHQRRDGASAGISAAAHAGLDVERSTPPPIESVPHSHPYPIFPHPNCKNFVDFDEDLHLSDFVNAHQEGYDSVELIKRYSTVGMGPSQGKISNMNAVRIVARLNGASIDETGSTTARPFYQPVPIGHLAGRRFHPMRRTPIHQWHADHGAHFYHAGDWYRPEFYANGDLERTQCIAQEAHQVRSSLGLIDVSTLGKFQVNGPGAAELLERLYTGRFKKLAVGRYRYGVALDESGVIVEDGVLARLASDQFYVTATSSGASAFYREMQRWALIWNLDVTLNNTTGHLAALNLAGPNARNALQPLTNVDLSPEDFPYQGVRRGQVAGVESLLIRVGFVGELGYEIHLEASKAEHVWKALFETGARWNIQPFGVEAQRLLRLEKGHLIVTHDTDALTYPHEVGLNWTLGKNKHFYVGQHSLKIQRQRSLTRQLVGLRWPENQTALPEECNLIIRDGRITGRITSIVPQSTLGYPIGMAFVDPELSSPGTPIEIRLDDGVISTAQVVEMPFYDPDDQRQLA